MRLIKEWLEKKAELEDKCKSISVGGLAHELGLYTGQEGTLPCKECGAAVKIPEALFCNSCALKEIESAKGLIDEVHRSGRYAIERVVSHPKFLRMTKYKDQAQGVIYTVHWDGGSVFGYTPMHVCELALTQLLEECQCHKAQNDLENTEKSPKTEPNTI